MGGHNFGCGSSREHAPWALLDYGIRAVISTEIADIFRSNSLKNGLVPIVVDAESHRWLLANPGVEVLVDVATATLEFAGKRVTFPIDKFSRYCLMNGVDQLGFLMERERGDRPLRAGARMTERHRRQENRRTGRRRRRPRSHFAEPSACSRRCRSASGSACSFRTR